jgi:hypothetical protein|tara:strand:+ start:351 stop:1232 length:882 start_codon:yes stop_codon:yes gene_type:complete
MPNKRTLLNILSGGRYSTSQDLPTAREVGSSAIDRIIESDRKRKSEVLFSGGKNIFGKPAKEFTQGDLEDLITGIAGTTKPIMSAIGLGREAPRNPIYHITNMSSMKSILDKGVQAFGGRASFTRDPNLKRIFGKGEQKLQLVLDKDLIEKSARKKLSPFSFRTDNPKSISKLNESEERLIKSRRGAPLSSIKAIRVRGEYRPMGQSMKSFVDELTKQKLKYDVDDYKTLLTNATRRNIPVIIPESERKFVGEVLKKIDREIIKEGQSIYWKTSSMNPSELIKRNIYYTGKNK